jgi:HK97 family phage major capsid protein
MKGNQKKEEVFTLLKRTTTPQTIYKKQKLDRDDITDITDFDVVAWIKGEMRMMLDEEIARAILIGDGRANDSDDKIHELNIRPIAKDVDLFNIKASVNVKADATDDVVAKTFIDTVIRSRKKYKGSGNPVMFTTADMLTEMLLLEDGIGHKLYKSIAELTTALRVSRIVEVEVFEGQTINNKPLAAVIVNLQDYNVGADKGGAVSLFDDFDIDYNQYKYLIETRCSGALIKPFSAITVTVNRASA